MMTDIAISLWDHYYAIWNEAEKANIDSTFEFLCQASSIVTAVFNILIRTQHYDTVMIGRVALALGSLLQRLGHQARAVEAIGLAIDAIEAARTIAPGKIHCAIRADLVGDGKAGLLSDRLVWTQHAELQILYVDSCVVCAIL